MGNVQRVVALPEEGEVNFDGRYQCHWCNSYVTERLLVKESRPGEEPEPYKICDLCYSTHLGNACFYRQNETAYLIAQAANKIREDILELRKSVERSGRDDRA